MKEADTLDLPPAPYPGLRPFIKEEWPIFFGRESMTQDVIARLVKSHLVAVHGDSGCGKSSLIAAGVLPILENDQARSGGRWTTCIMRPGDQPLSHMAKAIASLAAAGQEHELAMRRLLNYGEGAPARLAEMLGCSASQNVCILFDQFEELFEHARKHGPAEARLITAFLSGLVQAKPHGLHVILTMRSDYLGQCAQYQGFAEAVNETQYLVPRMERAALMRAIREPAQLFNGAVSAELADRLIADAGTGQDQLPLIQHGLMLLWQQKITGQAADAIWALALEDYRSAGTLSQLLSNHADGVLEMAAPSDEDKIIAENTFRALIDQNADGQAIRRRARFGELCAITGAEPERLQAILGPFRAADASFLRPYGTDDLDDEDAIDVSHEAFLRNWSKIADPETGWLAREMRAGQQWLSLRLSANKFELDKEQILSAAPALSARLFLATHRHHWSHRYGGLWSEVDGMVRASVAAVEKENRHRKLRMNLVLASAVVMAVLAFALLNFWSASYQIAEEAIAGRQAAEKNESLNLETLSKLALLEGQPVAAVKLALAAWPRIGSETRPQLRRTLNSLAASVPEMRERMKIGGQQGGISSVNFSRDGKLLVAASVDQVARIFDSVTGKEQVAIRWPNPLPEDAEMFGLDKMSANLSPDGKSIVARSWENTAIVWDVASGIQVMKLSGHLSTVVYASFSPDGTRIVTGSVDKTARVWDAVTGAEMFILNGHDETIYAASFSPDGKRIVTASGDKTARIWDAVTAAKVSLLNGHDETIYAASFSPDGKRIVTASGDKTARIWDAATGAEVALIKGHESSVYSASFSPDGSRIVTGSSDDTARIWNAVTGSQYLVFKGHEGDVTSTFFSPDGSSVITASDDGTARIWDATMNFSKRFLVGHKGRIVGLSISPDSTRIVTASADRSARIWGASTGAQLMTLNGHGDYVVSATFSSNGQQIVTASRDKTARIWDAATGEQLLKLSGHDDYVFSAQFSHDGQRVITASGDFARIWDAKSGNVIAAIEVKNIDYADFSPDGSLFVTTSGHSAMRIWDATTGVELHRFTGGQIGFASIAGFTKDGSRVLTTSADRTANIWDTKSKAELISFRGPASHIGYANFSADGERVVTSRRGSGIMVYPRSGIVSAADIWDATTGVQLTSLYVDGSSWSADSSFDGRFVAAANGYDAVIWDISNFEKGDAFEIACQRLGNNTDLSDVEARYGLGKLPPICGEHKSLPVDFTKLQ